MEKTCTQCSATFEVSDSHLQLLGRLAPSIGGNTFELPPPTLCPECRQRRRFSCRNDRNFYPNTCSVCNKKVISSYSEDKSFSVICDECFWKDEWDPLTYGQDYDVQKPFFEQFRTLRERVPRLAIYQTQSENSTYSVHSSRNRNCYMCSSNVDCEDVLYSDFTFISQSSLDLFSCEKMELCYECIFCEECFQSDYCENSNNLSDCLLCFDCKSSDHLIGCVGLRNAKNQILNKEATLEECKNTILQYKTDPIFRANFQKQYTALKLSKPHRASWQINTENCTGNYIWSSKNATHCFNVRHLEDTAFMYEGHAHTTTCDTARVANGEMLYECASIVGLSYAVGCNLTYQCANVLYCDNCNGTENSFGSVSLKKHQWCILNKQYTQGEYEDLVPKIIEHMRSTGEWGEFFPIATSPFGYNETKACEWYPLEQEEVLQHGWKWSYYEAPNPKVDKTVPADKLPASVGDIPDDILNWAITCEESGKPFKLTQQELQFYRQRNIPIPHLSPKQRYYNRIQPTNVRTLYNRTCVKCSKVIQTTYSPDSPETVYCEECYLAEVY